MPADSAIADPSSLRIAVLTYRRPEDIRAALPRLLEQALSVTRKQFTVDILVVDNDPAGSAREFVTSFAAAHHELAVRYENETTPGISAARNRALESSSDRDLLVFIDDDERPSPRWLATLVATYRRHGSAAVVGPVISEYEVEPDSWVQAGLFFARRRLPTGTRVEVAATNNLLLDLRQVRHLGLTFDQRFGISGGGDTMFTRALYRGGAELIWCDEAPVTDIVPATRVTREWVVRRSLRMGNSWSATSLALTSNPARRLLVRLQLSAQGLVRLAGGGARYLAGMLRGSQQLRARGVRTAARGAGMLLGAWGYAYQEYRRPIKAAG